MSSFTRTISVLLLFAVLATPTLGLDYDIEWIFDQPLEEQTDAQFAAGFEQLLIYKANSGELVYHSPGALIDSFAWNPPNLLSKSGQFIDDASLTPFPFYRLQTEPGIIEYLSIYPRLAYDQPINHEIVYGSTTIEINNDNLGYWPGRIDDPGNLALHGLEEMPTSYSYGFVLPTNLDEAFLLRDIYASSPLRFVYQIPEPSCALLALVGLMAGIKQRTKRVPA